MAVPSDRGVPDLDALFDAPPVPMPEGVPDLDAMFDAPPPTAGASVEPARAAAVSNASEPIAYGVKVQDLRHTVYRTSLEDGFPDDVASQAAEDAARAFRALGPGRNYAGVEGILAARTNPVTARKALSLAFGPGVIPVPPDAPKANERAEEYRSAVRSFDDASWLDAVAQVWKGEETPDRSAADVRAGGMEKPWLQFAKDAAINSLTSGAPMILDAVAHLVGEDIEGGLDVMSAGGPKIARAIADDPDVQTLASGIPEAATGLLLQTGGPQMLAAAARGLGMDDPDSAIGAAVQFVDDATPRKDADAALKVYYETGDRTGVDAVPWRSLPSRLQASGRPDVERVMAAATDGVLRDDPAAEPLRAALAANRTAPEYLAAQVERLPLASLRLVQPELWPTSGELADAHRVRSAASVWAGGKQADAAVRLMGAGLLRPVGENGEMVFRPSRFVEVMRLAGTAPEMIYEADVQSPTRFLPGAAASGVTSWRAKVDQLGLPTKARIEAAVLSGAYDDWLHAAGLEGSDAFAPLRDPESDWSSRVMADLYLPDHQGPGYQSLFERAGGDPESTTAKALGTTDVAIDLLLPAEELVGGPFAGAAATAMRSKAALRAAREAGLPGPATRRVVLAAMAPRLEGAVDGVAAVNGRLRQEVFDGLLTGRLDPDAVGATGRERLVGLFGEAGVANPEGAVTELLDYTRDRRARILDETAVGLQTGGPATWKLRDSVPYTDRARDLDDLVTAGNLAPRDRDLLMRSLEAFAFRAADDGRVASPEEFFARHRWERGVDADVVGEAALQARKAGRVAGTAEPRNLLVQHNLTAENLLHADELGGLVAPSLAVARVEHPPTGFGEITLVGPPTMADPNDAGIRWFDADVYSPRWPSRRHVVNAKKAEAWDKANLRPYRQRTGELYVASLADAATEGPKGESFGQPWSELKNSAAMRLKYTEEVLGQKYNVPTKHDLYKPSVSRSEPVRAFFRDMPDDEVRRIVQGNATPEEIAGLDAAVRAHAEADAQKVIAAGFSEADADVARRGVLREAKMIEGSRAGGTLQDVPMPAHMAETLATDELRLRKPAAPDGRKAANDLRSVIAAAPGGDDAYEVWLEQQLSAVRGGSVFVPDGRQRPVPYTAENILAELTKNIRAGESFNYGLGNARARGAKEYKARTGIQADRARVVSKEEMEAAKTALEERFNAIVERAAPHFTGDRFYLMEEVATVIGESYRKPVSASMRSMFKDVPPDLVQEIAAFAEDLRKAPTEYFEGKARRVVPFREFVAAVVPDTIDPRARAVLERDGLEIVTYKRGDDADRAHAIAGAARRKDALFSERDGIIEGAIQRAAPLAEGATSEEAQNAYGAIVAPGGSDGRVGTPDEPLPTPAGGHRPTRRGGGVVDGADPGVRVDRGGRGDPSGIIARAESDANARYQRALTRLRTEMPDADIGDALNQIPAEIRSRGGSLNREIPWLSDLLARAADNARHADAPTPTLERFAAEVGSIGETFRLVADNVYARITPEVATDTMSHAVVPVAPPGALVVRANATQPWAVRLRDATRRLLDLYGDKAARVDAEWLAAHPDLLRGADPGAVRAAVEEYRAARNGAGLSTGDAVVIEGLDPMPAPVRSASESINGPFHARTGATVHGAITPEQTSRWLLRLFSTGDVETAFHEGGHLIDLMMGEGWTREAAHELGFTADQIASAFDAGDAVMLREIRERLAEGVRRVLRNRLRPGGRASNVLRDFTDTLGDVWARVRGVPEVAPKKFVAWWDAALRPDEHARPAAIALVDERYTPREMRPPAIASGVVAEEVAARPVLVAGQRREAGRVDRTGAEIRAALGLKAGQATVDPLELLANAMAYVGTERVRRRWGFGKTVGLTTRVALPEKRARQVLEDVDRHRNAALGGKAPTPIVVDGAEFMDFDVDQQAGLARLVAEVRESPLGETLPESLTGDLSRVSREDYNSLMAHMVESRAGAGAFREREAERAAASGAFRLWDKAIDTIDRTDLHPMVEWFRERFVVSHAGDRYLNPAQRDVIRGVEREIGDAGKDLRREANAVKRALRKAGIRDFTAVDILRRVSNGMAPEVVPVDMLGDLGKLSGELGGGNLDKVSERANDLHRLFAGSPIASATQTADEIASLAVLDNLGRRTRGGMPLELALDDTGTTLAQAEDAMSIVLEGLRRRAFAVEDAATDILVAFAGSPDRAVISGLNNADDKRAILHRIYAAWYEGRWDEILAETTRMGQSGAGPRFDQGTAAATVLLRLKARRILGTLAHRMAEVGVLGDAVDVARGGLRFDRAYTLGGLEGGRDAYVRDVANYISTITGWKDTATIVLPVKDAAGKVVKEGEIHRAPGRRTVDGREDMQAYMDARRILSQWGFRTGKGTGGWDPIDLPGGGSVMVPDLLRKPIEEVVNRAAPSGMAWRIGGDKLGDITKGAAAASPPTVTTRSINAAWAGIRGAYDYTLGMMRSGLTTGLLLPNPAFYVGNAFGGALQLFQGVGAADALSIMARPLLPTEDGATIRRVLARMWADGEGALGYDILRPAERGFFAKGGQWWSDAAIADEAARAGLNSSLAKTEAATSIIRDIKQMEPTWYNAITRVPREWQRGLVEAATAIDNYYRVSTFVDGLRKGRAPAEAAELARNVAFDYNALTEFERSKIRPVVMFYSFMRRNQDLFWRTLLENPSRVLGQLRATRGLQQQALGEDSPLFLNDYLDGRAVLMFRNALADGRAENEGRGMALLTPRTPVGDAIGFWLEVYGTAHMEAEASRDMLNRLDPMIKAPIVLGTGTDLLTGREIDAFNTVPNWLVEMDRNLTGGLLVDDLFGVRPAQWRDAMSEGYPGAPRFQTSGRGAKWWWFYRNLLQTPGAGRSVDTITALQRADLGESVVGDHGFAQGVVDLTRWFAEQRGATPAGDEPDSEMARPWLTEREETLALLGIRPQRIEQRDQILARLIQERGREVATEEARVRATREHRYGR